MSRYGDFMINKNPVDFEREMDEIYQMGYAAYHEGKKLLECPYKGLPLKPVWEEGFIDAMLDNEPIKEWNEEGE
jgi:ribosome modulation factor